MLNLAVQTLFRHETSVQSCFFSVCIPSGIRLFSMKHHLVEENFMEFSEIHLENMFYPYICIYPISLVNVSSWG